MLRAALVFLGVLLVASGAGKLAARESIAPFVQNLGISRRALSPLAIATGIFEVALGGLLVFGVAIRFSAILTAVLTGAFLGMHLMEFRRGTRTPCRCFGALDTDLSPALSALRSAVLFAAAVVVAVVVPGQVGMAVPVLDPDAAVGGALGGLTYMLMFLLLNEVSVLVRRDREVHEGLLEAASKLGAHNQPN